VVDSLTFGIVLTILGLWLGTWAVIGAAVAAASGIGAMSGAVHGLTFGPFGVLFVVLARGRGVSLTRSAEPVLPSIRSGVEAPDVKRFDR
jgi:hypothetical protein